MIPISFASRNVRHFEEAICKCRDLFWRKFTTYRSEDIEKCWKVGEVAASVRLLCRIWHRMIDEISQAWVAHRNGYCTHSRNC